MDFKTGVRRLVLTGLGAFVATLFACDATTHDEIVASLNRKSINKNTTECMQTRGDACKKLGEELLHKSYDSRTSDWAEPLDKDGAKRALDACCATGMGDCCAKIVEYDLTNDKAEEWRYRTRAAFYGARVRTAEEIADEEEKASERAERRNAQLEERRAQEAEEREASRQQMAEAIQSGSQQLSDTLSRGSSTSSGGSSASSSGASSHSSSSSSGGAGGTASANKTEPKCVAGTSGPGCCANTLALQDGEECSYACNCAKHSDVTYNTCQGGHCCASHKGDQCGPYGHLNIECCAGMTCFKDEDGIHKCK